MSRSGIAVFLGGVAVESPSERKLAYRCGRAIGRLGYILFHGGYNGLMEDAARGASAEGVQVVAITLAHKEEWGKFNPYVTRSIYVKDLGERLSAFFSHADVVIAMGGGVGTLHEITAAIWYAGNVRRIPVILLGHRAERLLSILKEHGWIYESPTRPVDFLHIVRSAEELDTLLCGLQVPITRDDETDPSSLRHRLFDIALLNSTYVRADGTKLGSYFDPFRLCAYPKLIHRVAMAIATQVRGRQDFVAGIALGGVPLATHIASLLGKPLLVVRPSRKPYGTNAQVEGLINQGGPALLVDDVVRHGAAMIAARTALKSVGVDATDAACIVSYGRSGYELLQNHGVTLHSLLDRPNLDDPTSAGSSAGA